MTTVADTLRDNDGTPLTSVTLIIDRRSAVPAVNGLYPPKRQIVTTDPTTGAFSVVLAAPAVYDVTLPNADRAVRCILNDTDTTITLAALFAQTISDVTEDALQTLITQSYDSAGFLAAVFAVLEAGEGIGIAIVGSKIVITNTGGGGSDPDPPSGLTGQPMGLSLLFTYSS